LRPLEVRDYEVWQQLRIAPTGETTRCGYRVCTFNRNGLLMLWTILVIAVVVLLVLFLFNRSRSGRGI